MSKMETFSTVAKLSSLDVEAIVRRCSSKQVFLKNSKISL